MSNSFDKPTRKELMREAVAAWEEPFPEKEKPRGCQHPSCGPLIEKALREMGMSKENIVVHCPDCGWTWEFEMMD